MLISADSADYEEDPYAESGNLDYFHSYYNPYPCFSEKDGAFGYIDRLAARFETRVLGGNVSIDYILARLTRVVVIGVAGRIGMIKSETVQPQFVDRFNSEIYGNIFAYPVGYDGAL